MIKGIYRENKVYIYGVVLDTERSQKLRTHSPDGSVSWGYLGSGPSQLALALLLDFGATDKEALDWYQDFKRDVIAQLPETDFEMKVDRVSDWLDAKRIFVKEFGE